MSLFDRQSFGGMRPIHGVVEAATASNPWLAPAVIGGSAILSGVLGDSAADAQAEAAEAALAEERRQFDLTWNANAPYRQAGVGSLGQMSLLTGQEDPRIEAYNDRKNQIVQDFRANVTANQEGPARTAIANMAGADIWENITDEQVIELLTSGTMNADMEKNYGSYGAELTSLGSDLERLETEAANEKSIEEIVKADPSYEFRFKEGLDATKNILSAQNRRLGGSALKAVSDYGSDVASQEYGNIFGRQGTIAGYGPAANVTPSNQISQNILAGGQAEAGRYSAYNQAIQGGIQNYLTYDASQQAPNTWATDYSIPMTSRDL